MTVTVPHYVTTDGAGRWTGTGATLTATQFDTNFYTIQAAINALSLTPGVGVASISQPTAGTLLFTMSDASTQGPFPLPVGEWNFQGDWTALTAYIINDVVQYNSSLYAVIFPHTSGATFDPGANDGAGHDYYRLILTFPSGVLPVGGTTGQALTKVNSTDFNTQWTTLPSGIPTGGSSGKFVAWLSSGVGQWANLPSIDLTSGVTGVLPIANGGTGTATPGIVAGSNITVTGTWPNQTVASTGGGFSPVISSPATDDIIAYDGANWVNVAPSVGGLAYATSSSSRTLALTDAQTFILVQGGGAQTYTAPPHSSVAFNIGAEIALNNYYSGGGSSITIAPGSTVVLLTPTGEVAKVSKAYGTATLRYVGYSGGSYYWLVTGDLDPAAPGTISGTGTVSFDPNAYGEVAAITPTGAMTLSPTSVIAGSLKIIFTTSGTTSYTITFGTNFKSSGTLATGTVSGKVFVVDFVGDGTTYYEIARSAAL
jgi:hypothetical protein